MGILVHGHGPVTPASIRLDRDKTRYLTYIIGFEGGGEEATVVLDPIGHVPALPTKAQLDFVAPDGAPMWLTGELVAGDEPHRARFVTRRGPERRPPRAHRLSTGAGSVYALFLLPNGGHDRACDRVLDLGPQALRLASRTPLDPGTALGDIVVVSGTQVVRHCDGTVLGTTTTVHPDGRRSFEVSVRLKEPGVSLAPRVAATTQQIRDDREVHKILWGLCDLELEISLCVGTVVTKGRLLRCRLARDRLPDLVCVLSDRKDLIQVGGGAIVVEASLWGAGYRFIARVVDRGGDRVVLAPAPVLREWHRRSGERIDLHDDLGAAVSFVHPIDGQRRVRKLVDVGAQGFAFEPMSHDGEVWSGLPISDIQLQIGGREIAIERALLCSTSRRRCGVRIDRLAEPQAEALRAYVVEAATAPVQLHDGSDLAPLVDFHHAVHMLYPEMEEALRIDFPEVTETWRRAHQAAPPLMRTAVAPWRGSVGATLTSVRAYERGWVFQHLAVASPAVTGAGLLHTFLMRVTMPRADCEYVCGFVHDKAARALSTTMSAFVSGASGELQGSLPFSLYLATGAPVAEPTSMRRLRGAEEATVEHAARRLLPEVCVQALSLRAGEIELPATEAAFRRLGIERGRQAYGGFEGDDCVAVLLREWGSPGLSLSGLLSTGMLLPVRPDRDPDGRVREAMCRDFARMPQPGASPFRLLFLPAGTDDAPVLRAGYRHLADFTFFALHRLGLEEYHRFVAGHYGHLLGRLRVRQPDAGRAA